MMLTGQSPKSRKVAGRVAFLKDRAEVWERQVEELKDKVKAEDLEEVERKLREEQESNYQRYNYLNERYAHLD